LIDTGSKRNVLSVNVAREITKVRLTQQTGFKGLSGSVKKVYGAEHTELRFDHLLQYADNQLAFDLERMNNNVATETPGVLGVETFGTLDVIIDYRDGLVAFEPITQPGSQYRNPSIDLLTTTQHRLTYINRFLWLTNW